MTSAIKKVVIAGGGTAGWICAAGLAKGLAKNIEITLVESDAIPSVGVGEATIPPLLTLHKILGISESEFMAATSATFKLGIAFENWRDVGDEYIHSFGFADQNNWACTFNHFWLAGKRRGLSDAEYGDYLTEHLAARRHKFALLPGTGLNYAYHLDAGRYAMFLREFSEKLGVKRHEGTIEHVKLCEHSGNIQSLQLVSGDSVEGDLFIDCTGFRALLMEALNIEYEDWTHYLPCDRAIAVQTQATQAPIPYTRSIAHKSAWQWQIPLQHRVGNGLVYCSQYQSDDSAKELLLNNIQGKTLSEPKLIKFQTGTRKQHWTKNCIAVGLSSGFLEPLESTSIHLIQRALIRLMRLFPTAEIAHVDIDEFNEQTRKDVEQIRDFIIMHYKVTNRTDSDFWQYCRNMSVPDSLQHRIALFKQTGRVFRIEQELFAEESWIQVMMGQGIEPEHYHPVADAMSDQELNRFLTRMRESVNQKVQQMPEHQQFLDYYCKAKA